MIGTLGQFVREIRDKLAGAGDPIPVDIGQNIDVSIDSASIEISNDAGNPVPISDGGDSLTVDGTVNTETSARTPTTTSVASSESSVVILASNSSRRGFSMANMSNSKLYLSFASPASIANCFIEVPANAFFLLDQQLIVGNAIYGVWATADGFVQVTEYV